MNDLPKAIKKTRSPLLSLPAVETERLEDEHSDDLQGEGMKNFIPSNIVDIYCRLAVLLG